MRTGILAATGEFRVFTDADLPYRLDTIPAAVGLLDIQKGFAFGLLGGGCRGLRLCGGMTFIERFLDIQEFALAIVKGNPVTAIGYLDLLAGLD